MGAAGSGRSVADAGLQAVEKPFERLADDRDPPAGEDRLGERTLGVDPQELATGLAQNHAEHRQLNVAAPDSSDAGVEGQLEGAVEVNVSVSAEADRVADEIDLPHVNFSAGHIAAFPGKDYAILAWITKELIDNGPLTPKQPVQGLERLRAVLEGYTRAKAAAIAGVTEQECQALLDAIRRRGRCSIETGTGVTMSAGCNMTQFFAWTIMVLTGSMNAKGGAWFHPGFINQYEKFELPIMESAFTPGPKTRPESKGILGEWPCAVLPTEIEAGNIRALFNFGGHIIRSFPDTNALTAALKKLELNVNTEIARRTSCPRNMALSATSSRAGTSSTGTSRCNTARRWFSLSASAVRPGGYFRSS